MTGNRRNPRAKWVLPLNLHPTTHTDWCVPVPDDPFHRAAFLGALQNLGAAYQWQDDPAHSAKIVARVWRDIIDDLQKCMESTPIPGIIQEDFMPLRIDCDCNVFVTCCDGTEKQILTSDQIKSIIQGQPGAGTPQPDFGTCQDYHAVMQGNGKYLVPTPVSTGDTIEILNARGAGNDGSVADWRCYDGTLFFAGECIEHTQSLNAGDPLPTIAHLSLIVDIDGTFHSGIAGALTVGSAIANVQPDVQLNDAAISDNYGEYQFDVRVCRSPAGTWRRRGDFRLSTQGFIDPSAPGISQYIWSPGVGFIATDVNPTGPSWNRGIIIDLVLPGGATISSMDLMLDFTQGFALSNDPNAQVVREGPTQTISNDSASSISGSPIHLISTATVVVPSSGDIEIKMSPSNANSSGALTGSATLIQLELQGTGTPPSWGVPF